MEQSPFVSLLSAPDPKFEQMLSLVTSRLRSYSCASVRLALSIEQSSLKLYFGRMDFYGKTENPPRELLLDYGDLVLLQRKLSLEEAIAVLRGQTIVDKAGLVQFKGSLREGGMPVNIPSGRKWGYIRPSWPSAYYYFQIDPDSSSRNIPQRQLFKLGLPPYPDGASAVASFCDLDTGYLDSRMLVLIPDFTARISGLRIKDRKVALEVETQLGAAEDLRAKFYCETEGKRSFCSNDLEIVGGSAEFAVEGDLVTVLAHILSKEGNDIDSKDFHLYGHESDPAVTLEASRTRIEELARRGEGLHIEYKRDLPSRERASELLESVVAFANTGGGTILLGINDNGEMTGIETEPANAEETIINWIAQKCDPRVVVHISRADIDDRTIVTIDVPLSLQRPHIVTERGPFIRTGSTDRIPTRSELDGLYKR